MCGTCGHGNGQGGNGCGTGGRITGGVRIRFWKMSGSGNDFVIVDDRQTRLGVEFYRSIVTRVCHRNNGVGADGLIIFNDDADLDFRWDFFNADGSIAEMCGNGSRCAARLFSLLTGRKELSFSTLAGEIEAVVEGSKARVRLSDPAGWEPDVSVVVEGRTVTGSFLNTGVPHFVIVMDDADSADVKMLGRALRFHDRFAPKGTNVNFVSPMDDGVIKVRTYERGVEDETLACGTGACASAIVCAEKGLATSPVEIVTSGGERLTVRYAGSAGRFTDVWFEGRVRLICEGEFFANEL